MHHTRHKMGDCLRSAIIALFVYCLPNTHFYRKYFFYSPGIYLKVHQNVMLHHFYKTGGYFSR